MARTSGTQAPHSSLQARLLASLQAGDVDSALRAGLMEYAASEDAMDAPIRTMQQQLHTAWAARERYRARELRLARRAAERDERRAPSAAGVAAAVAPAPAAAKQALPAAAAAALARARARAAGRGDG
ncbi:hypothetical protein MNQ95_11550 [Pseudoxanthomonas daejeonensis]|uniref:Uncharacterized protein n=1 Tax=Pseudoxanthomonas daejeonensis TaxID=266062 RepID=A0ABQ6Z634_9GAMM|nr:hypothetical protein [Pseudoxanthomonas daejeonensis]KAF1693888.1 hypothetical protein CSC65_11475 [Pseudoxanthomonas daejeonensis]UNK56779.1 hypothetical protein MNQ95_11550 [Pseudoxanthomonas daejeonensis]